ncbi:hypothetical protein ACRAWC_18690 [Leifsonia sp. L25]|uniref:hypothetical protein n=1 Tax=Actinomycetes TaxID=1760 RepID=UPI003D68F841
MTTGIGGGTIGVPIAGIAGGYALAGRRRWLRMITGVLAVLTIGGVVVTVPTIAGESLASPVGAWLATLIGSLMIVLMLAAAIPFRALARADGRVHAAEVSGDTLPREAAADVASVADSAGSGGAEADGLGSASS